MNKNEFLAFSLPYDVKAIDTFSCIWTIHAYKDALDNLRDNEHLSYENFIKEEGHRLILHPLPDLTKPIEHKGEKFVPAMALAKIIADIHNDDLDSEWVIKNDGRIICKTPWDLKVEIFYNAKEICFSVYDTWNHVEKRTINQFTAFQKLIEWHFDLFDGIKNNEAINVNTLEENPYK